MNTNFVDWWCRSPFVVLCIEYEFCRLVTGKDPRQGPSPLCIEYEFCRLVTLIAFFNECCSCVLKTNFVDWWQYASLNIFTDCCVLKTNFVDWWLKSLSKCLTACCVLKTNFVDWWLKLVLIQEELPASFKVRLCIEYEFCRLVTAVKASCFFSVLLCIEYEFCRLVTRKN